MSKNQTKTANKTNKTTTDGNAGCLQTETLPQVAQDSALGYAQGRQLAAARCQTRFAKKAERAVYGAIETVLGIPRTKAEAEADAARFLGFASAHAVALAERSTRQ